MDFTANDIFNINSKERFNELALQVFKHQYQHNKVYQNWCSLLKTEINRVQSIDQIPFLPIESFKSHRVICEDKSADEIIFTSSSTTSQIPSRHHVLDISIYKQSFSKGFELFYGKANEYCILALLPGYLERKGSSLVFMVDELIKQSDHELSGFYLNQIQELKSKIERLKQSGQKTMLWGVSYALLDLCGEVHLNENFIVIETGGMKGNRAELSKSELHEQLKAGFGIKHIHSEYGMTEMLSQAYSKSDGIFQAPPWLQFKIREINDPLHRATENKTGGIDVIDLTNFNSCSFIATKDLGRINERGLQLMGRYDVSDVRGCNLMYPGL
ncbi:MAG: acyl transferase [Sphingobacteriaceae bacterium]|nr:acyl transferase [Sphingobacteriaceae bacterium]